jgi:hypothetical protein
MRTTTTLLSRAAVWLRKSTSVDNHCRTNNRLRPPETRSWHAASARGLFPVDSPILVYARCEKQGIGGSSEAIRHYSITFLLRLVVAFVK